MTRVGKVCCKKGHELPPRKEGSRQRVCNICARASHAAYRQRKVDARGAPSFRADPATGLVYGLRGRPIGSKNQDGYVVARIKVGGKPKTVFSHRYVWESVNGPIPDGFEINHINGIKTDNSIGNLELVTRQQNIDHAWKTGLRDSCRGESMSTTGMTLSKADAIRASTLSTRAIAKAFGISKSHAHAIKTGQKWSRVDT